MKLGIIGLGNMATAMIGGIIKAGIFAPADITGSDVSQEQRQKAGKKRQKKKYRRNQKRRVIYD